MVSLYDCQDDRALWYSPSTTNKCLLLFGGIDDKKKARNDLWMIEPDVARNKLEVFSKQGNYQVLTQNQNIHLLVSKISAAGRSPMPRYGHASCIFKRRYMVVHGGRNDALISKTSHFILNDIHLYDYCKIK
jgi:hypothetical protein